jgi:hypothetical protein
MASVGVYPIWPPMYKPNAYDAMVFMETGANGVHYYAMDSVGHVFCIDSPTSCIQEAINYLTNQGGGVIFVRNGTYTISTPLTVTKPIMIVGKDRRSVTFNLATANAIYPMAPIGFKSVTITCTPDSTYLCSQRIYADTNSANAGASLYFEDVDFYIPYGTMDSGFIRLNDSPIDVTIYKSKSSQMGQNANTAIWFYQSVAYSGSQYHAMLRVKDFVVDAFYGPSHLFKCDVNPDFKSEIDDMIVKYVEGPMTAGNGAYVASGPYTLRNIKVLSGNIIYADIASFGIAENIELYVWGRIGVVLGTTGIINNAKFYAGGGIDLGQPSSGTEVRAILNNIYLNGGYIYFGGYRYVEINNVVCDNSGSCVSVNDEVTSGNPINVVINNAVMYATGANGYQRLFTFQLNTSNIQTVLINNSHLYAKYNPNTQYTAAFIAFDYSYPPYSNSILVQVSNSSMYGEKPRSQGGPYMTFTGGDQRGYETQIIRVVNGTFYADPTLPFGKWSWNTPWGTPLGRYDRIVNALFLYDYNWSPYSYENVNTSSSVTVGTSGSYGSAWVVQAPGGAFKDFDIAITWGGTFASGETVTVQIQVEYDDGSTNSITVSSTSTGTTWLTPAQKMQLFASNKSIVRIYISAASNQSSTSVTVTAQVIGSS